MGLYRDVGRLHVALEQYRGGLLGYVQEWNLDGFIVRHCLEGVGHIHSYRLVGILTVLCEFRWKAQRWPIEIE
jgi:hypothetical protein